ncbi:MAG TPA: protein kinase [Gemmataceae bacterium]|nr:protein kinase [Gemmataceae bacterium]
MTTPHESVFAPLLERFAEAWERGERPNLDDYLPAGSDSTPILIELVRMDLDFRLKSGEAAKLEAYLERYPRLAAKQTILLSLLNDEYQARLQYEPDLNVLEYIQRFPQLGEQLQRQWATLPLRPAVETTPGATPAEPAHPPLAAAPVIAGYEILSVLGKGGMGVVYKARQLSLKRLVALKMIRAEAVEGSDLLTRFRKEAEAIARLQHPHIVQIHDIGEYTGELGTRCPYMALELVEGDTLAHWLSGRQVPPRTAAELTLTLARAVQTAHQYGIIHRDLKPANILLASGGHKLPVLDEATGGLRTPLADLAPKIADFGLAKQIDEDAGQTQAGQILGTPNYMAPEQAEGRTGDIGPATDVYALGAILYEMLSGRPPFIAPTLHLTLEQVRTLEPTPPSRLQPRLPRDLETICLKCLHKEPSQRYHSALALAQDLERFLADEPILARREGIAARMWRKLRRQRILLGASAAVLAVALVAGYFLMRYRHVNQLDQLQRPIVAELDAMDGTAEQLDRLDSLIAQLQPLDATKAGQFSQAVPQRLARFLEDYLRRDMLRPADKERIDTALLLLDGRDPVAAIQLRDKRDSRYRNWETVFDLRPPFAGKISLFDTPQVEVRNAPEGGPVLSLTSEVAADVPAATFLTPNGEGDVQLEAIFQGSFAKVNALGLVLAGHGTQQIGFAGDARALAFAPDSRTLATGGGTSYGIGRIHLWDATAGRLRATLEGHSGAIGALTYASDGRTLASGGADGEVLLWDVASSKPRLRLSGRAGGIMALAFSPDRRFLAAAFGDGSTVPGKPYPVKVWHTDTGVEAATLTGHQGAVWVLAFSPDGGRLASGSSDGTVRLWDVASWKASAVLPAGLWVPSLAFAPKGTMLAVAAGSKVQRWELDPAPRLVSSWEGHAAGVYGVAYSPDGQMLVSVHDMAWLKVWNVADGRLRSENLIQGSGRGSATVFAPDGWTLATSTNGGIVKMWDVTTWRSRARLGSQGYVFRLSAVASSPAPPPENAQASKPSLEPVYRSGGLVRLQILREGVVEREEQRMVRAGAFRLRARRESGELRFQLNDLDPLVFRDVWPLDARAGRFGVLWTPGVGLARLHATQGPPATVGSSLEQGDHLYGSGRYLEAAEFYQTQARTVAAGSTGQTVRHEAECKRGLCLLALNQRREAQTVFSRLANEEGRDPWLLVAFFQLWLMHLENRQSDEAGRILVQIQTRYPEARQQVAALLPSDMRVSLHHQLEAAGSMHRLVFVSPGVVERLDQAVLVDGFLHVSLSERLFIKQRLLWALRLTNSEARAKHVAEEILQDSGTDAPSLLGWPEYGWLMHLAGRDDQVPAELERASASVPVSAVVSRARLLLERSRWHARLRQWREAESRLDELARMEVHDREVLAGATLLRGVAREQRGDADGARQVWKQGAARLRTPARSESADAYSPMNWLLQTMIVTAQSGAMTDAEAERFKTVLIDSLEGVSSDLRRLAGQHLPASVLRAMWQSEQGRDVSRRIACRELSQPETFALTMRLTATEILRQQGWPGQTLSREQNDLVWELTAHAFSAYGAGRFTAVHAGFLAAALKRSEALFAWTATERSLSDAVLRGDIAYVLGCRYLHGFKRPDDAASLFRLAVKLAAPDSMLRRLAQAELDRIGRK